MSRWVRSAVAHGQRFFLVVGRARTFVDIGWSDRIAVMNQGRVEQVGAKLPPCRDRRSAPATALLRRLHVTVHSWPVRGRSSRRWCSATSRWAPARCASRCDRIAVTTRTGSGSGNARRDVRAAGGCRAVSAAGGRKLTDGTGSRVGLQPEGTDASPVPLSARRDDRRRGMQSLLPWPSRLGWHFSHAHLHEWW